jgi:hypothetical protein
MQGSLGMKTYDEEIRNEYYRDSFVCVDLVEMHLRNNQNQSIPRYFTNGGMSVQAVSTLTGQPVTFTAEGEFLAFTSMRENLETSVGKFDIQLTAIDLNLINDIISLNTEGRKVVVRKAFYSVTPTVSLIRDPITIYEGYIYNHAVQESATTAILTVSCASLFADFERTAGRKTNNFSNWLFQGVNFDRSMDKAGFVGNTEFLWGRTSK